MQANNKKKYLFCNFPDNSPLPQNKTCFNHFHKTKFSPIATTHCSTFVGFEALTAVVMKGPIFWYITPCSLLKVNRRFGGTCRFHFQGRIRRESSACHLLSRWFLARLILRHWRWRQYVPLKRRLTFNGLHSVITRHCSTLCPCSQWIIQDNGLICYISLLQTRLHYAIIFAVTSAKPQKARLLKSRRASAREHRSIRSKSETMYWKQVKIPTPKLFIFLPENRK
jgi:hypothetical protein